MAIESPQITATCVEATEFPDLVRQYQVTGVPKTVVTAAPPSDAAEAGSTGEPPTAEASGSVIEILGALPEPEFVQLAVQALAGDQEPTA